MVVCDWHAVWTLCANGVTKNLLLFFSTQFASRRIPSKLAELEQRVQPRVQMQSERH